MAVCDLIPRLSAMTFSGARSPAHAAINRVHVGVVHGALGRELVEWRPAQVADYVRLSGSGRYAPGQTEEGALRDIRRELDALEARWPGLKTVLKAAREEGRPVMPAFEVSPDSAIVQAINRAYREVRGHDQPTGAITPPGYFGTDAGHLLAVGAMEGVVCGPGGRYNTMPNERVDVADFLDMIRIYMRVIMDICGVA
jgi:acetylornithine deacetylase